MGLGTVGRSELKSRLIKSLTAVPPSSKLDKDFIGPIFFYQIMSANNAKILNQWANIASHRSGVEKGMAIFNLSFLTFEVC